MPSLCFDNFEFPLPNDWKLTNLVAQPSEAAKEFSPNIVISREKLRNGETLATFAQRTWAELQQALNVTLLKEQIGHLGPCEAHRRDYMLRPSADGDMVTKTLTQTQLSILGGGDSIVLLTATDLPNHFESTKSVFDKMVSRAKFESIAPALSTVGSGWE